MTKIQWTDRTWNPVTGCTRVSEGCRNCYAERLSATRLRKHPRYANLAVMQPSGPRWTNEVRTHPDVLRHPLSWRKPAKVFVCDMSDLFHEDVPEAFIAKVFAIMAMCPHMTFQVLTKRPERMAQLTNNTMFWFAVGNWAMVLSDEHDVGLTPSQSIGISNGSALPLTNVWLGTSIEDQKTADARIPHLLRCPAAVRFLSAEPLLGPIDFGPSGDNLGAWHCDYCGKQYAEYVNGCPACHFGEPGTSTSVCLRRIHWVIVGGESGPAAKPTDIAHIRGIVQQCRDAAVACFVKQLGAKPILKCIADTGSDWPVGVRFSHGVQGRSVILADPKGGDPDEWPDDLRIREFPTPAEGGAA